MSSLAALTTIDQAGELEPCDGCGRQVYDARQVELTLDGFREGTWRLCPTCSSSVAGQLAELIGGCTPTASRALELAALPPSQLHPRRGHV